MRRLVLLVTLFAARAEARPTWANLNVALGDMVVGTQDVGLVAGEISVGKEIGPVQLRAEYDYLSLDQVTAPAPLEGVGHRIAGVVRWDWWTAGGDEPGRAIRFGFEAGLGQSMIIRWSKGRGTLLRPDLALGVSSNFAFRTSGRYLGMDIGMRVLFLPAASAPGATTQAASIRPGDVKNPFDWGLLFSLGVSYGQ